MNRLIPASLAAVLALGFAGTALAAKDHAHRHSPRHEHHYKRHDARDPRHHHHAAPRHVQRWRAPRPRGWHPGWREPHGNGYRYWSNDYYYVVPAPALELNVVLPLR